MFKLCSHPSTYIKPPLTISSSPKHTQNKSSFSVTYTQKSSLSKMDILEIANLESLKRYWRRRRYQRLDNTHKSKRKLKIARLGNRNQRYSNVKLSHNLRIKIISPTKLFAKFYRVYVDVMIRLVSYKKSNNGLIGEKKVPKPNNRACLMVSSGTNEVVDCRLVLEIYKRIMSSRESAGFLV